MSSGMGISNYTQEDCLQAIRNFAYLQGKEKFEVNVDSKENRKEVKKLYLSFKEKYPKIDISLGWFLRINRHELENIKKEMIKWEKQ